MDKDVVKCPKCGSQELKREICEDFLEGDKWEEFTCKYCLYKWDTKPRLEQGER